MPELVDTTHFPLCRDKLSYADPESLAGFAAMREAAEAEVVRPTSPPVADMVLAMGVAPIFGLFLVRFARPIERGELAGECEMWAVAGDLPSMCFETIDAPTPSDALRLYCAIAYDWADTVRRRGDLAQCYPIAVEPTRANAKLLFSRVKFIRKTFVPMARRGLAKARKSARTHEMAR